MFGRESKRHSRVFTLVELLVVIGIISILARLLLPALQSSLAMARDLVCFNNLRQNAMAVSSYTNDYRQAYPVVNGATTSGNDVQAWIAKYLEASDPKNSVLFCPEDTRPTGVRNDGSLYNPIYGANVPTSYVSYAPALPGFDGVFPWKANPPIYVQHMKRPHVTMMLAEGHLNWYTTRTNQRIYFMHDGATHYVTVDGHAVKADFGLEDKGVSVTNIFPNNSLIWRQK